MEFLQPANGRIFQFDSELHHSQQILVRHSSGNVINRLVPLIVESLESLNKLGIGLYSEFERLDRFDVMTGLSARAMTRRSSAVVAAQRAALKAAMNLRSVDTT